MRENLKKSLPETFNFLVTSIQVMNHSTYPPKTGQYENHTHVQGQVLNRDKVFRPANACLRMHSHGRKRLKRSKIS